MRCCTVSDPTLHQPVWVLSLGIAIYCFAEGIWTRGRSFQVLREPQPPEREGIPHGEGIHTGPPVVSRPRVARVGDVSTLNVHPTPMQSWRHHRSTARPSRRPDRFVRRNEAREHRREPRPSLMAASPVSPFCPKGRGTVAKGRGSQKRRPGPKAACKLPSEFCDTATLSHLQLYRHALVIPCVPMVRQRLPAWA